MTFLGMVLQTADQNNMQHLSMFGKIAVEFRVRVNLV